jgi:alpha-beta hydrolase superfamily lysophospholipase
VKNYIDTDPWAVSHVRLKTLKSLCYTPLPIKIDKVKTPICVIQGASDRVFPLSYTEYLFEKLKCEKELIIYKGLHHSLFFEAPVRVVNSILPWLDKYLKN